MLFVLLQGLPLDDPGWAAKNARIRTLSPVSQFPLSSLWLVLGVSVASLIAAALMLYVRDLPRRRALERQRAEREARRSEIELRIRESELDLAQRRMQAEEKERDKLREERE